MKRPIIYMRVSRLTTRGRHMCLSCLWRTSKEGAACSAHARSLSAVVGSVRVGDGERTGDICDFSLINTNIREFNGDKKTLGSDDVTERDR